MMPLRMGMLAVGTACACVILAAGSFAADEPAVHRIVIDGLAFSPDTLAVKRGDTVMWVNKDPFPHSATAADGAFDSKAIGSNKSWKYVASQPGDHRYTCTFHPTMKATLRVE